MLLNWSSSMSWPTFSSTATWRSCSATSSGLPTITYPAATKSSIFCGEPVPPAARAPASATIDCIRARSDASLM
jgi:hypothetical protein